jgi:enoyl-CoA hydratase/carnithine racemase
MMEMRTEGPVKTRREGAILEVTLDAPKANAISLKTCARRARSSSAPAGI